MTKLATLKEMQADGWKLRTIAGVKCLVVDMEYYKLVCQWRKNKAGFAPMDLVKVIGKLGMPDKTHEVSDVLMSLEYFTKVGA